MAKKVITALLLLFVLAISYLACSKKTEQPTAPSSNTNGDVYATIHVTTNLPSVRWYLKRELQVVENDELGLCSGCKVSENTYTISIGNAQNVPPVSSHYYYRFKATGTTRYPGVDDFCSQTACSWTLRFYYEADASGYQKQAGYISLLQNDTVDLVINLQKIE
jgi:hypothetical protein